MDVVSEYFVLGAHDERRDGRVRDFILICQPCSFFSLNITKTEAPKQLSLINYMVDVYVVVAASALASNTIARSLFGVVFPVSDLALLPRSFIYLFCHHYSHKLFAPQMFDVMTPKWACTLLGCFSTLCASIPFLLIKLASFSR